MLRREWHAHKLPSMVRGAMLARPTKRETYHRALGSGETHSSEWERTQTLRRERHAHRWPSLVRGAVLALPTASSGERRNQPSEWEGTQTLIRERLAHSWPSLVRGAVLDQWGALRVENSSFRVRGLRHPEGSGMLTGDPLWWGEPC